MKEYVINKDLTLLDSLIQIEKNHHRSLIVVSDNYKVVGSLSDGDIRRSLINGILLSSKIYKVMNTDYIFVKKDVKPSEIKSIFDKGEVFLLPCIDINRMLINLHVKS